MQTLPEWVASHPESPLARFLMRYHPAQLIKWTVYSLLLLNWAYYGWEEWNMAQHTLRSGGSLLDWTTAFSTTIDNLAWFGLLFLWELETYWLPYDWHKPALQRLFIVVRLLCYVFITHTVVARTIDFYALHELPVMAGVATPCDLVDQGQSWAFDYDYFLIDDANCNGFTEDDRIYAIDNSAVSDHAGLRKERLNRWIELQDALAWLLVMFSIEIAIWLQNREITGGRRMLATYAVKAFYGLLFGHAAYWAWNGHWVWAWDQSLWILGFFAIEMNVRDWREELEEEEEEERLLAAGRAHPPGNEVMKP